MDATKTLSLEEMRKRDRAVRRQEIARAKRRQKLAREKMLRQEVLERALAEKRRREAGDGIGAHLSAEGEELRHRLRSAATGLAQGLTLGWGDEILAGIHSVIGDEPYEDVHNRITERIDAIEKQAPEAALIGKVAGSVAPARAAAKAINAATKGAHPFLSTALSGGAIGAVSGAGVAPTREDMPRYAALGGLLGIGAPVGVRLAPLGIGLSTGVPVGPAMYIARRLAGYRPRQSKLEIAATVAGANPGMVEGVNRYKDRY